MLVTTVTRRLSGWLITLFIVGDREMTSVSDLAVERHQSNSSDLTPVCHEPLSDCDGEMCGPGISAAARYVVAVNSGSSRGDGGAIRTSVRDSVNPGVFRTSDPLWHQLQAVRRRLWILSATLESLPAKIELAYRTRSDVAGEGGPNHPEPSANGSVHERLAPQPAAFVGGWWARRRLTRLKSRAERAERRAAAAIREASASFGTALEAVLQAAVARVKADEACLSSRRTRSPRSRD